MTAALMSLGQKQGGKLLQGPATPQQGSLLKATKQLLITHKKDCSREQGTLYFTTPPLPTSEAFTTKLNQTRGLESKHPF